MKMDNYYMSTTCAKKLWENVVCVEVLSDLPKFIPKI